MVTVIGSGCMSYQLAHLCLCVYVSAFVFVSARICVRYVRDQHNSDLWHGHLTDEIWFCCPCNVLTLNTARLDCYCLKSIYVYDYSAPLSPQSAHFFVTFRGALRSSMAMQISLFPQMRATQQWVAILRSCLVSSSPLNKHVTLPNHNIALKRNRQMNWLASKFSSQLLRYVAKQLCLVIGVTSRRSVIAN